MNLIQQYLMTPNERLITVLSYIFMFGEAIFFLKLSSQILKKKIEMKKQILFVAITVIFAMFANIFIKNYIGDLINLLTYIILLRFIFHASTKDSIVILIVSYLSIFISAFLAESTIEPIINSSFEEIKSIPLYYAISCTLSFVYIFLTYLLIKYKSRLTPMLKITSKNTIFINLAFGIIAILIHSYILSVYVDIIPFSLTFISSICLLIYFFISMYSLFRTNKLEQTTKDLETEKIYNKTLTLMYDNIRGFKHDFDNIVQALGGYVALNDMEGLKEYYSQLLNDCKQTNNLTILNPDTINNPSIYSLLTNKYYLANEKGITMTFDIFTDLSNINFNIYEFTRILGILLDNAIEAAQETEEKLVEIEFKSTTKKQLFIITNSCKDNNISTDRIFEKGFSTKKQNSGIGLWKVHNILAKNTNLDLFTKVGNNKFKQQLEVYYN